MLYANTLDRLRQELRRKRVKPTAVYFSPSSDLFQPVPVVLTLAYQVLDLLLTNGIRVAFLTKGAIPREHMELLGRHASLVSAQIGLITTDEPTLQAFEPHAAPANVRLRQMAEFCRRGVSTEARLDPILPGITDDSASLRRLFQAAAKQGVRSAAASVLFLRPALLEAMRHRLHNAEFLARLLSAFAKPQRMAIRAVGSSATALPAAGRRTILDRVQSVAAECGIAVRICACKNPDLAAGSCGIAGHWTTVACTAPQGSLFDLPTRDSHSHCQ